MLRRALIVGLLVGGASCTASPAKLGEAPAFDLQDLAGGRVTLASLRGKVIVFDFWATWCGPCIAEIPEYKEFWKKNEPRGVEVIGVVVDSGGPQEIQDFVREHRIPYRQLLGNDQVRDAYGGNQGLPTTFVIDTKGMIVSKKLGSPPGKFEEMQAVVDKALAAR